MGRAKGNGVAAGIGAFDALLGSRRGGAVVALSEERPSPQARERARELAREMAAGHLTETLVELNRARGSFDRAPLLWDLLDRFSAHLAEQVKPGAHTVHELGLVGLGLDGDPDTEGAAEALRAAWASAPAPLAEADLRAFAAEHYARELSGQLAAQISGAPDGVAWRAFCDVLTQEAAETFAISLSSGHAFAHEATVYAAGLLTREDWEQAIDLALLHPAADARRALLAGELKRRAALRAAP